MEESINLFNPVLKRRKRVVTKVDQWYTMTKWFKIEYTLHSAHEHILASKQTENLFFWKVVN